MIVFLWVGVLNVARQCIERPTSNSGSNIIIWISFSSPLRRVHISHEVFPDRFRPDEEHILCAYRVVAVATTKPTSVLSFKLLQVNHQDALNFESGRYPFQTILVDGSSLCVQVQEARQI